MDGNQRKATGLRPALHARALPLGLLGGAGGGFGFFRELRKAGGVLDGNVREDFAVERHTGGLEAVNQLAEVKPLSRAAAPMR